ncbi:hypothetical protein [Kordiimonas sp.]|uniref:hypothetical protein n=1 Tax=Kordiimonas sp. TaxID=1970157 RepID=UPI003A95C129
MPFQKTLFIIVSTALVLTACANRGSDGPRGPGGRPDMEMDPAKMEARREEMRTRFLTKWDYNEDGAVTCDDITLSRSRLFRLLDENKDGLLVSGEYRHAKFEDKSFLFYDFLGLDKNGDGGIGVDELIAVPHSQFQSMDDDGDCTISPREMMASMREARMDGGRGGERRGEKGGRGGRGGKGGGRGEPL